jgi:hypothetical protein
VKKEMPNNFALLGHTPHQQALGQAINNIMSNKLSKLYAL